jgi:hypothetical protein
MKPQLFNATLLFYPGGKPALRLFALWYFTTLMMVWNILGHTVLGFEQSWATPVVAVVTAIVVSMFLDWVDALATHRQLRFTGGIGNFLNFLPACLIPGFACGMLLHANERLWPVVFAVVLSMGSKLMLRAPVGGGHSQHVFNPSNFGVGMTLVLFPDVSFAPPYHFTENLAGFGAGRFHSLSLGRESSCTGCSRAGFRWWAPGWPGSFCRGSFVPRCLAPRSLCR